MQNWLMSSHGQPRWVVAALDFAGAVAAYKAAIGLISTQWAIEGQVTALPLGRVQETRSLGG
jgi:hypothetical protein